MMSCDEITKYLDAYADGELEAKLSIDIAEHLRSCTRCEGELDVITGLKVLVRERLKKTPLPPELRPRVERALQLQQDSLPDVPVVTQRFGTVLKRHYQSAVAALVVMALGAGLFFAYRAMGPATQVYASTMNAEHNLCWSMRQNLMFSESDPQRLSDDFRSRLGYRVPLDALDLEGKDLLGGSICKFLGRKGAHVLYKDASHHHSYFVFRRDGLHLPAGKECLSPTGRRLFIQEKDGHWLVTWVKDDFCYLLVTDAPESAIASLVL